MIREYTLAAAGGVVLAVALELLVLRTGLFRDPRYWVALAIVACFQLLVNGVLTCPPIVSYLDRLIEFVQASFARRHEQELEQQVDDPLDPLEPAPGPGGRA